MDRTLGDFIKVLRGADVRVSVAETLDAVQTVDVVGYDDRTLLKNSLSLVLAKSADEKESFDACFDRFFSFDRFVDDNGAVDEVDEEAPGDDPNDGSSAAGSEGEAGGGDGTELQSDIPLGQMLLSGDRAGLAVAMAAAAQEVGVSDIILYTQRGLYTRRIMEQMGLVELEAEISRLRAENTPASRELAEALQKGREYLFGEVRDYVEQQLALHSEGATRRTREEIFRKIKLSNIEQRDFHHMHELVRKMAKRLVALHSRRRKIYRRGQLDVRRTLRKNVAYDGLLFEPRWKSTKIDRPNVIALCDVSGSVKTVARFLLLFLYSVTEVLPKVRSFAFCSNLVEVTELFDRYPVEDAIVKVLTEHGLMSTDYGQAFMDFKELCFRDVNHRTTVIILGDGRSNYSDPRADILKETYERSKRVIWLNPEPRSLWSSGDSEMRRLAPYCHQAEVCNSLTHLERMVSDLLRAAR
jgi:uncharacterized protein with von Willebrand factor type A (vWA) domain